MSKSTIKTIFTTLGKLLGILGLIYLFYTLSQQYTFSTFAESFRDILPLTPLLVILNIISILLGIYAWQMMLQHYGSKLLDFITSYYFFAKTEISKYLPGNVFHFIGRQVLAEQIGITQTQMAKISLLFSLLLLVATVLSSTVIAIFISLIPTFIYYLMLLASILAISGVALSYTSFPMGIKIKMNIILGLSVAIQGIILASIVLYQLNSFEWQLFLLCATIYIISWLIGFVTPGASGGLGVREGAFITIISFLHVDISSEIIVFSVLLVRLINILVDIVLFISTFLLKSKINTTSYA